MTYDKLDWKNADKLAADCKEDPQGAMRNASLNDFRLIAIDAANYAYSELMEKLEGKEELKNLLFIYSHLSFVHYQFEDGVVVSDIEVAKKEICEVYQDILRVPQKLNTKGKAKRNKK